VICVWIPRGMSLHRRPGSCLPPGRFVTCFVWWQEISEARKNAATLSSGGDGSSVKEQPMQYAVNLPILAAFSDPNTLVDLAKTAEATGWDGVFVWDSLLFDQQWMPPIVDPWIILAAIAASTERVKIGTMIAQLARRRPWKVAREVVTLDHLSGGRMILGVGLGSSAAAEFEQFGEEGDARVRADKLDECLDILNGLWSGTPFSYQGKYYQLKETTFLPKPVQQPRVPIWVAGY